MENFDLMKYLTGDYILQTRHGWRVVDLQLRPRSEIYKLFGTICTPLGHTTTATWTLEGVVLQGQENERFDLMMIPIK